MALIGTALAAARLKGLKVPVTTGPGPSDLEKAYAIQDQMIDAIELPVVGWKIGATNPEVQDKLKIKEPFFGPLFDRWVYPSPNRIPTPDDGMNIVETEFAFRMRATLPARDAPYTEDEVADAVEALYPALEVVDCRMPGRFNLDANWFVADGGANHAFCYGERTLDWRSLDLATLSAETFMDGQSMGKGVGANALGSPLSALTWLANTLLKRGKK